MRKFAVSVMIVFGLFTADAQAAGPYDGIWAMTYTGVAFGYFTVQENNGTIVAVFLPGDFSAWEAVVGPRNGNTVDVSTIVSGVSVRITGTFTSLTTFTGTQVSCVPSAAWNCTLPNGANFQGTKIW